MKTSTLELEEEYRFRGEDPEAPPEMSVWEPDPIDARPDREQVARRAYECWMERGCPQGSPEEDWFRAERELLDIRSE